MEKTTFEMLHAGLQAIPGCEVAGIIVRYKDHQIGLQLNTDSEMCLFRKLADLGPVDQEGVRERPQGCATWVGSEALAEALHKPESVRDMLDRSVNILFNPEAAHVDTSCE